MASSVLPGKFRYTWTSCMGPPWRAIVHAHPHGRRLTVTRTVRFHEIGGPEVLRIEELPRREPGSGEVRIQVAAIGLNRAEALFRRDKYTQKPELPSRIGYDAAGVVDAVGPDVTGLRVGDRVATIPAFPMSKYGVYGDEAVV